MSTDIDPIIDQDIADFCEASYLNYSMYVILDRALPSVCDGLKPVQRRILYAMSELGLNHGAKYKKSARTIGDVLGKFHPHGDSACYEAMVMMAQPFNCRYPLVDGQGNWGSQDDPKSFAAMRYTEARLTRFADTLLSEVKLGTTRFTANFDGTLDEPLALPARLPNVLLNSVTGIAVGMSTDIPPHNISEVVLATKLLIDQPDASTRDILELLPGPDFPTAGIIMSSKENLLDIYESGTGTIKCRASYHIEHGCEAVITELPYKVQGEKIIEKLAELMLSKKAPMLADIRDESDQESPTRIVLAFKRSSEYDIATMMEHLFALTDLEVTKKINLNVICLNGTPAVCSIRTILLEWIAFRKECFQKRLRSRLALIDARMSVIDALIIAHINIDRVIRIVRESDSALEELMSAFLLTKAQASAILDTRIRSLAKLQEQALVTEKASLGEEAGDIRKTLSCQSTLNEKIKLDIDAAAADHLDARRSVIRPLKPALALREMDIAPSEPVTAVLSAKGWLRCGKGHGVDGSSLAYKTGDAHLVDIPTVSSGELILIDDCGRSYSVEVSSLPSIKSYGEPITAMVSPAPGRSIIDAFDRGCKDDRLICSSIGYGFFCPAEEFYTRQKKGKVILNPAQGTALPSARRAGQTLLCAITRQSMMLIFSAQQLPTLQKGKGNKVMGIGTGDALSHVLLMNEGDTITIHSHEGSLELSPKMWAPYAGGRATKGKRLPATLGEIVSVTKSPQNQ